MPKLWLDLEWCESATSSAPHDCIHARRPGSVREPPVESEEDWKGLDINGTHQTSPPPGEKEDQCSTGGRPRPGPG